MIGALPENWRAKAEGLARLARREAERATERMHEHDQ